MVYYGNAGTNADATFAAVQYDTVAGNITVATTIVTKTQKSSQAFTTAACRVYNDTSSNTRCVAAYYDASDNVQFGVVYIASSGALTFNTLNSTFTNTSPATNQKSNLLVSLAPDTSVYIQGSGATIGGNYQLQCSIITTSGATVSNISTLTNVVASTGSAQFIVPKYAKALSATQLAIVYQSDTPTGNFCANYVGIIDITSGTPTLTTSALLTPSGGFGTVIADGAFNVGADTGVCLYWDGAHTFGVGFSYTTSTVTVSAVNTSLINKQTILNTNYCTGVSPTEIMALLGPDGSTNFYMITLAGINSVSIGTAKASSLYGFSGGMVTTENQNAVVYAGVNNAGSNSTTGYLFRG